MALNARFAPLLKDLRKVEDSLSGEILKKALRKGGEYVLEVQKNNVPVDTGYLRDNLEIYDEHIGKFGATIKVGVDPDRKFELEYAFWQEWGTSTYPPTRWLSGSWSDAKEWAYDYIQSEVAHEVAKALKK